MTEPVSNNQTPQLIDWTKSQGQVRTKVGLSLEGNEESQFVGALSHYSRLRAILNTKRGIPGNLTLDAILSGNFVDFKDLKNVTRFSGNSLSLGAGYDFTFGRDKRWAFGLNGGLGWSFGSAPPDPTWSLGLTQYNLMPDRKNIDLDYPMFSLLFGADNLAQIKAEAQINKPLGPVFPQVAITYALERIDGKFVFDASDPDFFTSSDGELTVAGAAPKHSGSADLGLTFNPNFRLGQRVPLLAIKLYGGANGSLDPREELGEANAADQIGWKAGAKFMLTREMFTLGNEDTVDLRDLVRSEVGGAVNFIDVDAHLESSHQRYKKEAWTWCNAGGDCIPDLTQDDYNISTPDQRKQMLHEPVNTTKVKFDLSVAVTPFKFKKMGTGETLPFKLSAKFGVKTGFGEDAGGPKLYGGIFFQGDFGGPILKAKPQKTEDE